MKRYYLFVFMTFFSTQINAFGWSDLWSTPDQQGQNLMKKAQFSKAKERFQRSDWLAAAAYKSGDYQQAAKLFQDLNNEKGYYNQGNALAHLKQYEEAIKAYNKALALNAQNQDALYNRKIVEELLKKEKENKENKDQQSKDKKNKDQQKQDQQDKDQQSKNQQNKDQQDKDQQNKEQQSKEQQSKEQQSKEQQKKDQEKKDQEKKDQEKKDQQNKDQEKKDKEDTAKKQDDSKAEVDKEKQEAKEQWLRLIPDDPGGLMREKFLRDHLRRESGWYQ